MNYKIALNAFNARFSLRHVILYVGQNISDQDIKDWLCQYPWSCILTSRRDAEFSSLFLTPDRTVIENTSRSEISNKPLNKKELPVIRLCGKIGESKEDDDLAWLSLSDSQKTDDVNDDLISLLPELLDCSNSLVIVGCDSAIDWDLLFKHNFVKDLAKYASNGTVEIWGIPENIECAANPEACSLLQKLAEQKSFGFYHTPLAKALKESNITVEDQFKDALITSFEDDSDIYYQGHSAVGITQQELLAFKNVGTLLTDRTINRIKPLGRIMCRKWFSNFLENSSSMGPQWYGYLPQSTFYVKRSFEDALVATVRKMLDGKNLTGSNISNRLIILSGTPGSSKSITLAALAYRIFNEKINPVIFISKDSYLGSNVGTSIDELDDAMHILEVKAKKETRILVVWDSSAFREGVGQAKDLLRQLENRGRRFVLVCSSYITGIDTEEIKNAFYFSRNTESEPPRFVKCDVADAQVLDAQGCYFVRATREMDDREVSDFWKRVKDFSGIDNSTIKQLKQKLKEDQRKEIFEYYYIVISLLRDSLEQGLRAEQSKVAPYVEGEIKKVLEKYSVSVERTRESNPFYKAFLSAGYEIPEQRKDTLQLNDEIVNQKVTTFNICVALFSRFKLSMPYGIAYAILIGDEKSPYVDEGQQLYQIVTRGIPWIYYGEDDDGDYSFRFRNSLEADIFLRDNDATGEKQVELICRIINMFGENYRRSRFIDLQFAEKLQALLRLVGPNSQYTPFSNSKEYEHRCILSKLDQLIEEVEALSSKYGVPDEDAGFASIIVTFTREYYSSIWNKLYSPAVKPYWEQDPTHFSVESYELRIAKLIKAIALAQKSIEAIDYGDPQRNYSHSEIRHLFNQKASLIVEMANCNMRLEELIEEYKKCCSYHNVSFNKTLTASTLSFKVIYNDLLQVINRFPTNGYAYNALFKAFIQMYNSGNWTDERKLQHLSEIMQVIETCETLNSEIMSRGSRGKDELSPNIINIRDIGSNYNISLSAIEAHRDGKEPVDEHQALCFKIYDDMLAANNPAAITFVCQKELQIPKDTRVLNEKQLSSCRRVYNFMKEQYNFDCISSDEFALAMLIRVCWMLYNHTTLTIYPECQLTCCSRKQWEEINYLCRLYNGIAREQKQPLIILLYALSELHVSDLSEAGYLAALRILKTLDEYYFYQPNTRLKTPFMVCDNSGQTYKYSGRIISMTEKKGYVQGFIQVNGLPQNMSGDRGVRFRQIDIGRKRNAPSQNEFLNNLELGIGFTSFSVYTEVGRKEKEARS